MKLIKRVPFIIATAIIGVALYVAPAWAETPKESHRSETPNLAPEVPWQQTEQAASPSMPRTSTEDTAEFVVAIGLVLVIAIAVVAALATIAAIAAVVFRVGDTKK